MSLKQLWHGYINPPQAYPASQIKDPVSDEKLIHPYPDTQIYSQRFKEKANHHILGAGLYLCLYTACYAL